MAFVARLLLNGVAIIVAAWLIPGLEVTGPGVALVAGIVLGFVNALVRPVLILLTLPLTLLTLGLFIFVVNAVCLGLTAAVLPGFSVSGFWSALLGALVVSIVSWMLSGVLVRPEERR
jgi:putative membrane protein